MHRASKRPASLRPDFVLLDIGLPDVEGFEVARSLAIDGPPPLVVLTSSRGCKASSKEGYGYDLNGNGLRRRRSFEKRMAGIFFLEGGYLGTANQRLPAPGTTTTVFSTTHRLDFERQAQVRVRRQRRRLVDLRARGHPELHVLHPAAEPRFLLQPGLQRRRRSAREAKQRSASSTSVEISASSRPSLRPSATARRERLRRPVEQLERRQLRRRRALLVLQRREPRPEFPQPHLHHQVERHRHPRRLRKRHDRGEESHPA